MRGRCTYLDRVKLHTRLDNINRAKGTVGDRAADSTGGGSLDEVHEVMDLSSRGGGGEKSGSRRRHDVLGGLRED